MHTASQRLESWCVPGKSAEAESKVNKLPLTHQPTKHSIAQSINQSTKQRAVKEPNVLVCRPAHVCSPAEHARAEIVLGVLSLPGRSMCLGQHGALALLSPAVFMPEVHDSQLYLLPVEALSTSHLKALHDCMKIGVVPG